MIKKRLAVFDVDHTILNGNTDIVVRDMLDKDLIPANIKLLYKKNDWIEYMQEIFKLLHKNNIKKDLILKTISEIDELDGMKNCIKILYENNFDTIIISDSNSQFINKWLEHNKLIGMIKIIYTNPAYFDENDQLIIKPYHVQYECKISSVNLCKGQILIDYINENKIDYKHIFYIGDGRNDICPILKLKQNDYGCIRKNFSCDKEILNYSSEYLIDINCNLIKFTNGNDLIYNILKTFMDCKEIEKKYQLINKINEA